MQTNSLKSTNLATADRLSNSSIAKRGAVSKPKDFNRFDFSLHGSRSRTELKTTDWIPSGSKARNVNSKSFIRSRAFIIRIAELTNRQRVQAGIAPLRLNLKLSAAAYTHSRNMALNDFFGHTGSDGSRVGQRVAAQGYKYSRVGENIAAGYATPEQVMEGWMNSPGHRANILSPDVREIGVGFYFLANDSGQAPYQYYWTQNFAATR